MSTTPFFVAAAMSIMLPSAIEPASRVGRTPLITVIALAVSSTILVVPVITRSNWQIISATTLILITTNLVVMRLVKSEYLAKSTLVLVNIVIAIVVYANSSWVSGFNGLMHSIAAGIEKNYAIIAHLPPGTGHKISVTVFGLVFVTVGMNYPIALVLKTSGLMPPAADNAEQTGKNEPISEPARGKAIGYLERAIVLLLMVSNNTAAIGFVLAAKAFARFNQLNERDFAEYVLIGTLMSFGSTIAFGITVPHFM